MKGEGRGLGDRKGQWWQQWGAGSRGGQAAEGQAAERGKPQRGARSRGGHAAERGVL